ncbi:MAG: type II toxin-antitoxin system VapC family toxin [Balneolaceae bacterium]|nr:type II toxin-antitoxin system VapC family toxin [Balneolaceae bacterium]
MVLLDTHIWLWWLLGDGALRKKERLALDKLAESRNLCISWTTLWETEMLERKARITLLPDFQSWITQATNEAFLTVLAVDLDVILTQRNLPESFHADPADRLIVATAMLSGYPLVTHDQRIRNSGVCQIWDPGH